MPDEIDQKEDISELQPRKANPDKFMKLTSWVAGMTSSIAVAVTVAMALGLFFDKTKTLSRKELTSKIVALELENLEKLTEISTIKNELQVIRRGLQTISNLPKGSEWKAEASKISQQVGDISKRMAALELALKVDPSKALAVPILRKDLDSAEKAFRAELARTRSEIDRIYDQNKWFIGLMFTIALSVLGLVVSSIFNRKDT